MADPLHRSREQIDKELEFFRHEISRLVDGARARGFVTEIHLESAQPLAMGHYRMVWSVRPCREIANG